MRSQTYKWWNSYGTSTPNEFSWNHAITYQYMFSLIFTPIFWAKFTYFLFFISRKIYLVWFCANFFSLWFCINLFSPLSRDKFTCYISEILIERSFMEPNNFMPINYFLLIILYRVHTHEYSYNQKISYQ